MPRFYEFIAERGAIRRALGSTVVTITAAAEKERAERPCSQDVRLEQMEELVGL